MNNILHSHVFQPVCEECGAFISNLILYKAQLSDRVDSLVHSLEEATEADVSDFILAELDFVNDTVSTRTHEVVQTFEALVKDATIRVIYLL